MSLYITQNIRFREVLEDNSPKQESISRNLPRSNAINILGRSQKYSREATQLPKFHFSPEQTSYRTSFADSVFPIELPKSCDSYTGTYSSTDSARSSSDSEDSIFERPKTIHFSNQGNKELEIANLAKQHLHLEGTPELSIGIPDCNPYPIKKEVVSPTKIKDTDPYVGALHGTRNNFPKELKRSYPISETNSETSDEMSTSPGSSALASSSTREADDGFLMFDMEI